MGKKEKVIGNCKLCKLEKELMDSHVIPEFMFRLAYDNNRALLLSVATLETSVIQQGYYEPLLCKDCEGKISKYETHVALRWGHQFPEKIVEENVYITMDLDYTQFRLFQLSILWRASVSKGLRAFEKVNLGHHEEIIRQMILNGDPGYPEQYAFIPTIQFVGQRKNEYVKDEDLGRPVPQVKDVVIMELPDREFDVYIFTYGGVKWYFLVSILPATQLFIYKYFGRDGKLVFLTEDVFKDYC